MQEQTSICLLRIRITRFCRFLQSELIPTKRSARSVIFTVNAECMMTIFLASSSFRESAGDIGNSVWTAFRISHPLGSRHRRVTWCELGWCLLQWLPHIAPGGPCIEHADEWFDTTPETESFLVWTAVWRLVQLRIVYTVARVRRSRYSGSLVYVCVWHYSLRVPLASHLINISFTSTAIEVT